MRTVGEYRLRELLGRGASSEVYAADHAVRGEVAVKLLRPELAEDAAQIDALVQEGARLAAIDHPNVVRVFEARREAGTCFLVMERVRGETLAARLRRERVLAEDEVRRIGAELADGVAAVHARGIVHRDLKPANVMFDGARPKLVDFGIAKYLGARSAVTTGRMIGTLAYMAPEQLSSGMIAPCTDLWALGVILFEAITGRHPFDDFADGRCPQLFDEPARAAAFAPAVSPILDDILARCLAREPARRPASAGELAALLRGEQALDDERITADAGPIATRPPHERADAGPLVPIASAPRKHVRRALWVAGAIGAAAAGVALAMVVRRETAPAPGVPSLPVVAASVAPEPTRERAPEPHIEIEPTAVAPVVEVRTRPGGAEVLVDGKLRGVTPLTLEVALPGVLELRRAGYVSVKQRVERAGVVDVALRPMPRPRQPPPPRPATKPTRTDEPLD